jgi:hypothetical protein
MGDPTAEFFDGLRRRGNAPALNHFTGTVRFDLSDEGETHHWLLSIDHGRLDVSRDAREADCVISGERTMFDQLALGTAAPLAAWLRNQVSVSGSFRLLVLLERLLPEPHGVHDPRNPTGEGRRRR